MKDVCERANDSPHTNVNFVGLVKEYWPVTGPLMGRFGSTFANFGGRAEFERKKRFGCNYLKPATFNASARF
jgi:hypothetical protein